MKNVCALLIASCVWLPPAPVPAAATAAGVQLAARNPTVARYSRIEFDIQVDEQYTQPFDPAQVEINLRVQAPSGRELSVPAFSMQDYQRQEVTQAGRSATWLYPRGLPGWRARFAPSEEGRFTAVAEVKDRAGVRRSSPVDFTCTPSDSRGFLRVSRSDPRYFEFGEGQPFFPIGQNLAFIGESQYVKPGRVEEIFAKLAENGANYLRVWTCCEDWAMAIEARKSAWGRSWSWDPPLAPLPDSPDPQRQCLLLTQDSGDLHVSPTHNVALRPNTRYQLAGRVRSESASQLRVRAGRHELELPLRPGRWQPFVLAFQAGEGEYWLGRTSLGLEGGGDAWIDGLSLKEADGGPELLWEAAVNRPVRGFYNPIDSFLLDEIVEAAQRHGIYLQLCLITRDVYMKDFANAGSPQYQRAIGDAKNLLRYAVGRWGYSTHVAGWEYFNENNPSLPMERFYRVLGEYLREVDVYGHLRSTSAWGPAPRDYAHPELDFADMHFYLRPGEERKYADEVEAAVGNAAWLREHAPAKPALLGEFGLADTQWRPTREMRDSPEIADFHNALWASALSGNSGTALFWWWDRLDQRNHYPHYRPLADFVADIPWTTAQLKPSEASSTDKRVRVIGLQGEGRAYLWLFDPLASFESLVIRKATPAELDAIPIRIPEMAAGTYRVQWWDTRSGEIVREEQSLADATGLQIVSPAFRADLACKLSLVSP